MGQLMSAVMYPKVFEDYMSTTTEFGDLSALPTRNFVEPMEVGEEVDLSFGQGVNVNVKLIGLGDLDEATGTRECFFEVNGFPRSVKRLDETAASNVVVRPKADSSQIGVVGDVKVAVGDSVSAGDPMVVLSAMKMETVCASLLFDSFMVTSKSPGCNASPIATETPDTMPSTDATQTVSIFIADSTTIGSPALTESPTATLTSTTTPVIGAPTAPICDESPM